MRNALCLIALASTLLVFSPAAKSANLPGHPHRFLAISAISLYDSLNLGQYGLSKKVYELALRGLQRLRSCGKVLREDVLSIVDFSQPSVRKRLYVIDLANARLLYNTYVAHGRRSGTDLPTRFSNRPSSLESSLGFYLTSDTYMGSNGYSLRLIGMEGGINDKAAEREIVLHGAGYVCEEYINRFGYLGRSWGCPAVPMEDCQGIIDSIKEGSCLFVYSPQSRYLRRSALLTGHRA